MFDFRYHALSLVAVFLALALGVLLGVAIGDAGLVSSGEKKIRDSLRDDVRNARAEANDLRADLDARTRYEDESYAALVAGRLTGFRVGLLGLGALAGSTFNQVKDALEGSGANGLASVSVLREPLDVAALARRASGTRYAALEQDPGLVRDLGFRIGVQFARGGKLLGRVRRALLRSSSGALDGHDAIVLVRNPPQLEGDAAKVTAAFEDGLVDGITSLDVPVVGIETTTTSPSQVGWFRDRDVASVDDVDAIAGRTALVLALEAPTEGAFGVKPSAGRLLPPPVGAPNAR